eukprot:GHVR01170456.1.p1 GENE.GHVR01170456.1~~GHVR01170456.1.p1  ORF type:complete len:108 (+),score=8.63 GHVR01170456.1:425-748(+)
MKLSKTGRSDHIEYRLNLNGLINLREEDLQASKKFFIHSSSELYPKDKKLIDEYEKYPYNSKELLRLYTSDCFFYKSINNTLRIAKATEDFFSIGEPFNQVFNAIKK